MYAIDLRPREFVRRKEFFLPRVMLAAGVIIYLCVLLALGFSLRFMQQEKKIQVKALEDEYRLSLLVSGGEEDESLSALEEELRHLVKEGRESGLSNQLEGFLFTLFIKFANSGNSGDSILNSEGVSGDSIQIQSMKCKENGRLTVTASAKEQAGVLKFILQLRETAGFKVLDYGQQGMEEGRFIFVFEIEFED